VIADLIVGIPPMHYGQDYYTLRSIFFDGVAPPEIHVHLRMFEVTGNVPIGDLAGTKTLDPNAKRIMEVDISTHEKDTFDNWLRKLWIEKDESMDNFFKTGQFDSASTSATTVEIPLKLRRKREVLDAFCFFWPGGIAYLWGKMRE
jgi:Acyltransferase C-terminus